MLIHFDGETYISVSHVISTGLSHQAKMWRVSVELTSTGGGTDNYVFAEFIDREDALAFQKNLILRINAKRWMKENVS